MIDELNGVVPAQVMMTEAAAEMKEATQTIQAGVAQIAVAAEMMQYAAEDMSVAPVAEA